MFYYHRQTGVSTLVGTDVSDELRRSQATFLTVTTRLLQSAAQRAQRSERRSQMWERERERRSEKLVGARARAALSKKAER